MLHDARGQQQDFRQQSYGLRRMAMAGSRGAAKDLKLMAQAMGSGQQEERSPGGET